MKSRSIRYEAPGKVSVIEIDVADPGPGEVQVRQLACGVCSWDLFTFKHGPGVSVTAPPGHEGLGQVIKVGPGVKGIKEGSRVVGGGFYDYHNLPASTLQVIPEESKLPDEHWIVEPVSCAVTGVDHCKVRAGDRIVVVGCGFMGLMLVQILGRSFADQLIAIDIDPRRLELARKFGATQTFNSAAPDFQDRLPGLKALSIDTVVDSTGAQIGIEIASKITRRGGCINLFGWNHGQTTFPGDAWHLGGFTVVNSAPAAAIREVFPVAIRLIHKGIIDLSPLVTHVTKLEEISDLLTKGVSKTEGYIKGVVKLA